MDFSGQIFACRFSTLNGIECPRMDLSVIIVTYRSAACIANCVASVRAQQGVPFELIVVDNASPDNTVEVVRGLGDGVQLLANRDNIGFGRGCNQGFGLSHGRFVYLLNPDARLVRPDALARLRQVMDEHPRWGMAGTRVVGEDGHVTEAATTYPGQARTKADLTHLPGSIAWVVGASMIFRREVFSALGGFDPDFFLYSEEIDLCLRLRKLGHEIGFVNEVEVRHIGGASEEGADPYDSWTRRMNGVQRFWKKHYPAEDALLLVRRDLVRARLRVALNSLLACFQGSRSSAWQKRRRYEAIRDTSARFLAANANLC